MAKIVNTFKGGMMQDPNALLVPNDVIYESVNGRIVYNENGTYGWENAKGTTTVFSLPLQYIPLCGIEIYNYLIIFSTNNYHSEIGVVTQNVYEEFEYQTAFNDRYDPYGDLLNFNTRHPIKASVNLEDNETINVYWDDDYNEPRVFNIMSRRYYGYSTPYPNWYSVHSMASMMDFSPSIVLYQQTFEQGGTCIQGQYQFAYRLVHRNGYATPYSTPCNLIMLAQSVVDGINWTNYQMGVSGIPTTKSIQIRINDIDTRYERIQIAAIYWETPTTATSAKIVIDTTITTSSENYVCYTYEGVGILVADISQQYTDITRAKTNEIFKSHLHRANAHLREKFAIDASNINIVPATRNMISDTHGASTSLPFTHDNPSVIDSVKTIQYQKANGTLSYVTHPMNNEYYNYKGTQWEHLFRGEFRSETIPFGIVLWDIKGQPMFVSHIADIVMPQQFGDGTYYQKKLSGVITSTDYYDISSDVAANSLNLLNGADKYHPTGSLSAGQHVTDGRSTLSNEVPLRILGKVFDNIDLTDYLYDANGKLQVTGFSIVRMPRYVGVLFQGMMAAIYNEPGVTDADVELQFPSTVYTPYTVDYRQFIHTPDLCFTAGAGIGLSNGINIQVLGAVYSQFGGPTTYNSTGGCLQQYYKNYLVEKINNGAGGLDPYYGLNGMATNTYWSHNAGTLTSTPPTITQVFDGTSIYNKDFNSLTHQTAIIVGSVLKDASIRKNFISIGFPYAWPVVNWTVNNGAPTISTAVLDNRIYQNIGHFVPINATTVAECTQLSGRVVFNGVEVWGGDCILDYWMYDRLLPYVKFANNHAQGFSCPIESIYNFQMQYGNEYAKVGTREAVTPVSSQWQNGYYIDPSGYVIEPFTINDVLIANDNWRLFYPLKSTAQLKNDYPITDFISELKVNGQIYDNFRRFLVNSFGDVDGVQGEINMLFTQFADLYFLQTNGLGRVRFDDRALVATSVGQLTTGTGEGFQGYDYINKTIGLQHAFGFTRGNNRAYWVDAAKGKLCRFAQDGLTIISDEYGMHNFFTDTLKNFWLMPSHIMLPDPVNEGDVLWTNMDYISAEYSNIDDPTKVGGVTMVYDYTNDSLIIAFTKVVYNMRYIDEESNVYTQIYEAYNNPIAIEFNETINRFVSKHDYKPNMFFKFKRQVLSNSAVPIQSGVDNKIWLYNSGKRGDIYDFLRDSILQFIIKSGDEYATYFDNGRIEMDITKLNPLQSAELTPNLLPSLTNATQSIDLSGGDTRVQYLEGVLRYPMMQKNTRQRMRGKYVSLTINIGNSTNDDVILIYSHVTDIRVSPKP